MHVSCSRWRCLQCTDASTLVVPDGAAFNPNHRRKHTKGGVPVSRSRLLGPLDGTNAIRSQLLKGPWSAVSRLKLKSTLSATWEKPVPQHNQFQGDPFPYIRHASYTAWKTGTAGQMRPTTPASRFYRSPHYQIKATLLHTYAHIHGVSSFTRTRTADHRGIRVHPRGRTIHISTCDPVPKQSLKLIADRAPLKATLPLMSVCMYACVCMRVYVCVCV